MTVKPTNTVRGLNCVFKVFVNLSLAPAQERLSLDVKEILNVLLECFALAIPLVGTKAGVLQLLGSVAAIAGIIGSGKMIWNLVLEPEYGLQTRFVIHGTCIQVSAVCLHKMAKAYR